MITSPRTKRTELEQIIEDAEPSPSGLVSHIETAYDSHAGLLYLARKYEFGAPYVVPSELPSPEWIAATLAGLIRGEFGSGRGHVSVQAPAEPALGTPVLVDEYEVFYQYLSSCERDLVFSGYANAVARNSGADVLSRLYSLLTHPTLGNSLNAKNVPFEDFVKFFENKVAANERLHFIFPGFPFKDQNPFRTLSEPVDYDLAEAALIMRLHTLAVAIYQTYHIGAEWIILTDGTAFCDALRVKEEDTRVYQENLRKLRNRLDLGRAISFVNFRDLARFFDHPSGYWAALLEYLEGALAELASSSLTSGALDLLVRGMKRNVNLTDLRGNCSWADWWSVLHDDRDQVKRGLLELWDEVNTTCSGSALKYAAFNLATKWVNFERQIFPEAIRATIHAKRGQIAVPRIGSEFPWNGVAFVSGPKIGVDTVTCKALHEFGTDTRRPVPYVDNAGRVLFMSY